MLEGQSLSINFSPPSRQLVQSPRFPRGSASSDEVRSNKLRDRRAKVYYISTNGRGEREYTRTVRIAYATLPAVELHASAHHLTHPAAACGPLARRRTPRVLASPHTSDRRM
uniref:Uncharacterized protein n=1 Tax=Parascaris univalens TaxID=6257 RepID=A0A915AUT0_PARUN